MGQLSAPSPGWRRTTGPWPRSRRRPWTRRDDPGGIAQMLAAIPSLPRAELSRLTTWMIDRMDLLDGDADVELNGDETDHNNAEDDFHDHGANWLGHPGCPIADPGEDVHDREMEEAHD